MKISSNMNVDQLMLVMGDSTTRGEAKLMREYLIQINRQRPVIVDTDDFGEYEWLELCKRAIIKHKF